MRKSLLALSTAAVIGVGAVASATPANAFIWWVAPAIIGGAVVGSGVAVNSGTYYDYAPDPYYAPGPYSERPGTVYVRPRAEVVDDCRIIRQRVPGGFRRIKVCD